jgi:transposase InsO family protein
VDDVEGCDRSQLLFRVNFTRAELPCCRGDECLNETLFASLPQARAVLDAWRVDYNGVRPHSALANRTPEEFRAQHIAAAASRRNGQNFNPGLYS